MERETLISILELCKEINLKNNLFEQEGIKVQYIESIGSRLENIILNSFNIPKDTTVELGFEHPDCFCRDIFSDWLYKYMNNELNIDELIYNLTNWKTISQD